MRKVNRGSVTPPDSLTQPAGAGPLEFDAAQAHYSNADAKTFDFSAYKGADVVERLKELFHDKCAYCETRLQVTSDLNVEHFRPKGPFEQCRGHRGYWWLAAHWENLLPSCQYCNQSRRLRVFAPGMTRDEVQASIPVTYGKASSFPLSDPSKYARAISDDQSVEDPLLIDPTVRDPAQHLCWPRNEEWSLVAPQQSAEGVDVYGWASMHTYGLNRQALVEARTEVRLAIKFSFAMVEELFEAADEADGPVRDRLLAKALDKLKSMSEFFSDEKSYSAMARAYVEELRTNLLQQIQPPISTP